MNYVIVGSGPAAINAAKTLKENDESSNSVLICSEKNPFYLKPTLVDFIAGDLSEKDLLKENMFDSGGSKIITGKRVVKVDSVNNVVILSSGERIGYNYLVIASGTVPRLPENLHHVSSDIFTLYTIIDAMKIKRKALVSKKVIVAGTGYIGIEMVRGLKKCGLEVIYLTSENDLWRGNYLGITNEDIVSKFDKEKVKIKLGDKIADIFAIDADNYSVITSNDEEIECNMVISAYSYNPNINFLSESNIKLDRGIVVNEELRTSVSNIFAAGDVAQVYDINRKINRNNFGWSSAWLQGEICARNILGEGVSFISDDEKFFNRLMGKKLLDRW
ncbi:MAG: NAD(P)/FAD-dependent oxidoreductase [Candidatus Schekmanbacteria bacterium]|nr:NAD(P)/FAD-dependent oxidoreductase [Candidatus Schekmanbacteria bacterium]